MNELDIFKDYIIPIADNYCDNELATINAIGFDKWFDNQCNIFLNCQHLMSNGQRVIQTNDHRYNIELTRTINLINECIDEESRSKYIGRLLHLHKANLEFEALNGFDYEVKTNKKKKTNNLPRKRGGSSSAKADVKLTANIAKLNNIKINIKPINNDTI